jgi:hypothetical protein
MVIYRVWINIIKDTENLLVFKSSAKMTFLSLESNKKTILGLRE